MHRLRLSLAEKVPLFANWAIARHGAGRGLFIGSVEVKRVARVLIGGMDFPKIGHARTHCLP